MSDEEWRGLVRATGDAEWARSPALATAAGRLAAIDGLHGQLASWTRGFDDRALAERLQSEGVAAAPVLNVADLLADPHYRARGTFVEVTHPLGFRETIYGSYVKTSGFDAAVRPGPSIGQDNDLVFKSLLAIPEDRYRALIEAEVIY
jgi:benzylsuccinate CoA-transferase BbsF subunit